MLPTPSTSHVDYSSIYEPSEDSYLLLDTLSAEPEAAFLQKHFPFDTPSPFLLEIGTGSGVVIAFLVANAEHIFGRSDVAGFGVDLNRFACEATAQTATLAAVDCTKVGNKPGRFVDSIVGDLASPFRAEVVDILVFNPPYVPSEMLPLNPAESDAARDVFERDSHLLSLSTDGGADGMETTDRLLDDLPSMLSSRGIAYVLLCAQNKPDRVMHRIRNWQGGWMVEVVGSSGKKAGWERLCIIRIWRKAA